MELLLRVENAIGETWSSRVVSAPAPLRPTVDVCVRVGREHTVAHLTAALAAYVGSGSGSGPSSKPMGMARLHRPEPPTGAPSGPLEPAVVVTELGLRSGERLVLATVGGRPSDAGRCRYHRSRSRRGPAVVVASGTDVGRRCALESGVRVGRDRSCELVLDDPNVTRCALRVDPVSARDRQPERRVGRNSGPAAPLATVRSLDGSTVSVNGVPTDGAPIDVAPPDLIRLGATTLRVEPGEPRKPAGLVGRGEPGGPAGREWVTEVATARRSGGDQQPGEVVVHRVAEPAEPLRPVVFPPLGDVPERPEPPRFGLLVALAPVVLGVTLAVLYSPRMLLFAAFAPVMAGAAHLEARRRNKARFGAALADFEARLTERAAEVDAAVRSEHRRRLALAPDLATLEQRAVADPPRLWSRVPSRDGGLVVRLGLGDVDSLVEVQAETRGAGELRAQVAAAIDHHRRIVEAPVTVDLASAGIVALVGERADTAELTASIVAQVACHQSPSDLVIAAACDPANPLLEWIGWLPHVAYRGSPLREASIAVGPDTRRLLQDLVGLADRRVTSDPGRVASGPGILLVLDSTTDSDPQLVSALLNAATAARIHVLWLADRADQVPWQTTVTVHCQPLLGGAPSLLIDNDEPHVEHRLEIDRLPVAGADRLARALAPCCDPAALEPAARLPTVATLAETMQVERFDHGWVADRWRLAPRGSLTLPLGLTADGPFTIDLVAHGPHGLIGGTSGSGKSELLISLVASLLATHPPNRVNVLFVDYKGGASSDPFLGAPHTVGCVTNLDSFLARRALRSLQAELNRRMALLAGRAKDLGELAATFPTSAPPALLIVVDELAALVQDVPEFVAGLVDIAQRGRSLGIHLLLATQRPAGVVNDQILANTNLRIALRMLDGTESSSLVGSREAASIPTGARGRALARLGPADPVAFQSAWSAAPAIDTAADDAIEVRPLLERHRPASVPAPSAPGQRVTQLDELLHAVAAAAVANHPGFVPCRPWRDELPATVPLADARAAARPTAADLRGVGDRDPGTDAPMMASVVLGLVDDPGNQYQGPATVDLSTGGLGIFGAGGAGATTALRTLAVSSALDHEDRGTGRLAVVGLDFGSGDLGDIADLRQCVEVASGDDLEAVTRIIDLLDRTTHDRRARRRSLGQPAPRDGEPTVLVLIDDYGNLAATFEGSGTTAALHPWFEKLNRAITDGRQLGVHTALTATRRSAVRAGVLSSLTNRIVLRQSEPAGFVEHGLPGSLHDADLVPGRGFLTATTQVQIAVSEPAPEPLPEPAAPPPGPADRPPGPRRRSGRTGEPGLVTEALAMDVRLDSLPPRSESPHVVRIGVADLAPPGDVVAVDLTRSDLVVVGGPGAGRSTALATIGHQLVAAGVEVWAIGDDAGSPVASVAGLHRQAFGPIGDVVTTLADLVESVVTPGRGHRPRLVIDDLDQLDRPELEGPLASVADARIGWLAATTSTATYSPNPFVQQLRRTRPLLHLRPESGREVHESTGVAVTIRPGLPLPPGRGVLIVDRRATVIQVART